MKRALAGLVLFVFFSAAAASADIVQANIAAVFMGTACAGCAETINISFQYDPEILVSTSSVVTFATAISINSSGFLGSFSTDGQINSSGPLYMPLLTD
jgi:opacity protein-like surface antigen